MFGLPQRPQYLTKDDRKAYAKLPPKDRNRLRKAWRALASKDTVDQRATTANGAPFPLRSWPPDAAVDIQNLAEWADAQLLKPLGSVKYPAGSLATGINRITITPSSHVEQGGITWNNGFVVPVSGHYLAILKVAFAPAPNQVVLAGLGLEDSYLYGGSSASAAGGGGLGSLVAWIMSATAGRIITPWTNVPAVMNLNGADFSAVLVSK